MNKKINDVKLGVFVLAGAAFLIFSLYMIGKNRNLFGQTFTIKTYFHNINGLVPGNNVRFGGIDVGTVTKIDIVNDTSIQVSMVIDESLYGHIRENAQASIGTDGLVGNKIVNINSVRGAAGLAKHGTVISSEMPVETDEMLRTLQTTNENIAVITSNLKAATERLNSSTGLWNILSDTVIVKDLQSAVAHLKQTGANTDAATRVASQLISSLNNGRGIAHAIFIDTVLRRNVNEAVGEIIRAVSNLDTTARQLKEAANEIRNGDGPARLLLSDTAAAHQISRSLSNIEQATGKLNENMEAMRSNALFRGYFKGQEKVKD